MSSVDGASVTGVLVTAIEDDRLMTISGVNHHV
jgi:hypothetical protein